MSKELFLWMGACLVVCAVGCGGTANGGSGGNGSVGNCQAITPCGGDVTGTWKIASVCQPAESADLGDAGGCAGLTLQVSILDYEGSVTFGAGAYTTMLTKGVLGDTLVEPASCLGQNTSSTTCDALSQAITQSDAGITGSCSLSGSNCVCSGTQTVPAQTASGTYSTSGTSITLSSSTTSPQTDGYCVQGNTLSVNGSAASTMMGNTAVGDLVLTRQ